MALPNISEKARTAIICTGFVIQYAKNCALLWRGRLVWLMSADCKSAAFGHRLFKSTPLHQFFQAAANQKHPQDGRHCGIGLGSNPPFNIGRVLEDLHGMNASSRVPALRNVDGLSPSRCRQEQRGAGD